MDQTNKPDLRIVLAILLIGVAMILISVPSVAQTSEPSPVRPPSPIVIENAYVRATGLKTHHAMVYMTITNNTGENDALTGASSSMAERVELHAIMASRGLRRMHEVDEIPLPEGAPVELSPGKYHIMLIGLKAPLEAGAEVPMELRFTKAPPLNVVVKVVEFGAFRKGGDQPTGNLSLDKVLP